jgi:hypothetical protein
MEAVTFASSILLSIFMMNSRTKPLLKRKPGRFDLKEVARKNILELTPYRCARDDYSEGILLGTKLYLYKNNFIFIEFH